MSEAGQDVETLAAEKLLHESEHLDALRRMQTLTPYYRWIHDQFEGHIGRRVLDAGCGVGNFCNLLVEKAELVVAADLSSQNLDVVRSRFQSNTNLEPLQMDIEGFDAEALHLRDIDTIVCLDVLEHVERDDQLLNTFRQIIRPGGKLLIKVPALEWLYGSVDEASDHYRRYSRKVLTTRVAAAGWKVRSCRYMNLVGVFPYWLKSRVLRKEVNLSRTYSKRQLRWIARGMSFYRLLDRLTGPPLGQSLVLVAETTAST